MKKTEELKKIKDEIINLKSSPLYAERIANKVFPVIGEGNHDAEIIFIGEALTIAKHFVHLILVS